MSPSPAQPDGGDAAGPHALDALRRLIDEALGGDPVGSAVRVDGVLLDLLMDAAPDGREAIVERARSLSLDLGERAARLARAVSAAPEAGFLSGSAAESFAACVAGPSLAPGDAVGEYRVLGEIGRGGMGVVYLAERPDVGLRAALKVLSGIVVDPDADPETERFLEERRHLAGLSHPNVARLYDAGTTPDGRPYFAMEHVDGETVTAYARRRGLGLRDRLALFEQVCRAVRHAHNRGLVHGDVKPENVLVTDDDEGRPVAKLLDFGVAARWRSSSECSAGDGAPPPSWRPFTYGFTAPEVVAGGEPTPASDVYALGVLLRDLVERSERRRVPHAVTEVLQLTIDRATSTAASDRQPSVVDLSAELRALPWEVRRTPRATPWAVGVVLGALAALAGAVAVTWKSERE